MTLLFVFVALSVTAAACYIKLYQSRHFWADQLPCLDVSPLWGHILAILKYSHRGYHKDRHFNYIAEEVAADLNYPPFIVFDLRPIHCVMVVIRSYDIAEQITRVSPTYPYGMTKGPTEKAAKVTIGTHSILHMEGEEWRALRKRYNPGFQPKYLQSLLPGIIKHAKTFTRKLSEVAETREVFSLGEYVTLLTFDIIGTITLNYDLKAQEKRREDQSPAARKYMDCLKWLPKGENPIAVFSPLGIFMRYYYQKLSDKELMKLITAKWREKNKREKQGVDKARSVVNLSFEEVENPTPLFFEQTLDQVKTFLFAGHDTTSSILQWAIYQLSLPANSHFLRRVRAEHDVAFGTDNTEDVENMIINAPEEIFGKLTLTTAIIKETLRLYPPAGTARMSYGKNFNVEWNGKNICLDGCALYICSHSIHRDKVWGDDVEVFNPDRWIEGTKSYRKVPDAAFRPFEKGSRSCIGKELAYIETRVVLVLVLRRFDFKKVGLDGITEPEVYNIRQTTAKPVDGMRMRVSFAER